MWKTIAKNYLQKKKPWQNFLQKICKKICAKKSPWKPSNNLLYLELLKAYQTNCFEVFNGFFCVDFLEFFLHQLFRLIFLVQKVLQNSGEKISQKNICKNNCNFFCKNLQKDLCKKIVQKLLKKICAKIIAKKYVQKEPLRASKKTCVLSRWKPPKILGGAGDYVFIMFYYW